MLISSIAQFSARRPVLYTAILALLIHVAFAVLIWACAALNPANASEFPNIKEAPNFSVSDPVTSAGSQPLRSSELWTVQVFTPGTSFAYQSCASHGEFLAQSILGSVGYSVWTCESYGEIWPEVIWSVPAGVHSVTLSMDTTKHSGCVLMEQAWNWQMGYGFRTYQCER